MADIRDFFTPALRYRELVAYLEGLDAAAAARQCAALDRRAQATLFEAAKGQGRLRLDHFVPRSAPLGAQVVHQGRNTLPLFSAFQKRFCRLDVGAAELWGYNEQTFRWLTGPGWFKAIDHGADEVLFDYTQTPPNNVAGWPAVRSNSAGFSRLVYHQMTDVMRGVSSRVSVGRAARGGREMDSWFVLARLD